MCLRATEHGRVKILLGWLYVVCFAFLYLFRNEKRERMKKKLVVYVVYTKNRP